MNQDYSDIVIGAGLAGLSTLVHSRHEAKQNALQVLEAADYVGEKHVRNKLRLYFRCYRTLASSKKC